MRPPPREVALYRAALRDVNTLAQRDLLRAWRQFDLTDAAKVRDGLMDVLPGIIDGYHLTAATVAADWYDLQRLNLGAKKRFTAVMADAPTDARGAVMARWGVAPMFSGQASEVAVALVLSKVAGGLQRVILNGARQTITTSATKDPARVGWVRVGNGECDWCSNLLDGEVHYVDGYDFDAHDSCLLPGTVVTGPRFEAAFRRLYQGEVVVVSLAGGGELAITPNHPVLTDRGWVDPHLLDVGDQVVQRTGADPKLGRIPDEQDVPTRIEDAWRAYSVDGLRSVPVAAEDFHGDGYGTQGEVQVVSPNGFLPDVSDLGLLEHQFQQVGTRAGPAAISAALLTERDLGRVLVAHRDAPRGFMGGRSSSLALIGGHLCGRGQRGRTPSTTFNASLFEPSLHNGARNFQTVGDGLLGLSRDVSLRNSIGHRHSVPSGDLAAGSHFSPPSTQSLTERHRVHADLGRSLLHRLAGGIELRTVVEVRRIDYSGHVYNLRTSEGWFDASSVVVANCRCDAVMDVS